MKYCANCGNQLDDNAKFCPMCGSKQPGSIQNIIIDEENTTDDSIPVKDKKTISVGKIALIITGIIVSLVSISALAHYTNKNSANKNDNEDVNNNIVDSDTTTEINNEVTSENATSDKDDTDDEENQEIGEMVLVSETTYIGEDYLGYSAEYVYDLNGNNIQTYYATSLSKDYYYYTEEYITYDGNKNMLTSKTYDEDGELVEYYEYSYYDNGEICQIYHSKGADYDYTFYNELGQMYEKDEYESSSSIYDINLYYYDENGNKISSILKDSNMKILWTNEYEYDVNNNLIKESSTYNDCYILYDYDTLNLLCYETKYYGDGELLSSTTYNYDAEGRLIEELVNYTEEKAEYDTTYLYEYDSYGNLVKYIWYDSAGDINEWYEYTYDFLSNVAVSGDEY